MRILCISYGFMVQRAYQWKALELARRADDFLAIVPREWRVLWASEALPPEPGPLDEVPHIRVPLRLHHHKHFALLPPLQLARILREFRPTVIDFDNEPFNLSSGQLVHVAWRHAPGALVYLHASQNLLKRYPPPFSQLEQYVFRRCGAVFARSRQSAEVLRLRGLDPRKTHVLGHGVSLEEFREARERQLRDDIVEGSVLYAGFLSHQKAVDTLVRACGRSKHFSRLTIAGEGPELDALKDLARNAGIADRTHFLGRVSQHELKALYAEHACTVLPSRTTPNLVEQFGRVLLESMAAGCPVIGSDSGAVPEVIGDAGIIFPEDDVNALTAAVDEILGSAERRRSLRESAEARVRAEFEWSVRAEQMIEVFGGSTPGATAAAC